MRPLTNNEYRRIQSNKEGHLKGASEIGFFIRYLNEANTTTTEWIEGGYMADFRITNFGNAFWTGAGTPIKVDQMTATCVLPIRYYVTDKPFKVEQAPSGSEEAMNKPFQYQILHSGSQFLTAGVPACDSIVLTSVNNIAPEFFTIVKWKLVTEPIIMPDGVYLNLQGTETLSKRAWMGADYASVQTYGKLLNIGGYLTLAYGGFEGSGRR